MIAVRHVCEKCLANGIDGFLVFMDLEKAHDTMWQVLRVYGVGGKLLKAVQSFYVDRKACVRIGMDGIETGLCDVSKIMRCSRCVNVERMHLH